MGKKNLLEETIVMLDRARQNTVNKAVEYDNKGEFKKKNSWMLKKKYYENLLKEVKNDFRKTKYPRSVFISYSKSHKDYFEFIKGKLEEKGFEIITGFERREGTRGNLLKKVLKNLSLSSIYLGIFTAELQVIDIVDKESDYRSRKTKLKDIEEKWAPNVWTVEEKGMALALGMPFVLIVSEEIHENYWKKTTPGKDHIIFNSESDFYRKKADEAVDEIVDRYTELAENYLTDIDQTTLYY